VTGLSFRDDLESLSYTVLRLVRGNLPWAVTSFQSRWDENIHFAVQDLKAKLSDAWLFEGLPSELADLRALARELQLGQAPDLQESIRNLTSLAASLLLEDYPWQPIEPVPYRARSLPCDPSSHITQRLSSTTKNTSRQNRSPMPRTMLNRVHHRTAHTADTTSTCGTIVSTSGPPF
jgi:hypothetical protein